ncbi:MAG: exopolysaccharide biosynthesis polyprenyl glycosylphosphotransferase [Anaerolineales bacterium]|nr:exopolysaccharide biosynthesis polyprenyl glycosylphosphotransferase [Anaerolineales bacterium]
MQNYRISPLSIILLSGDLILIILGITLSVYLRATIELGTGGALPLLKVQLPWAVYFASIVCWLGSLAFNRVYRPRDVLRWYAEAVRVTTSGILATFVLGGFLYFSYREISRLQVIYSFLSILMLLLLFRTLMRLSFRISRKERPGTRQKVVILGAGTLGERVREMILDHSRWGYNFIGFLDDDPVKLGTEVAGSQVLGEIDQIESVVETWGISEVWVALPARAYDRLNQVITRLEALPVRIYVVPDYFSLALVQARAEVIGGIPVIGLREPVIQGGERVVKRAFDLVVCMLMLLFALPLVLVIAAAIKLDSAGPVFFPQLRVGENGALFRMLKFRTMVKHAESEQEKLSIKTEDGQLVHKRPGDPRVTRVGRFLRRFSLDELPQLLNVLRGEMSMVGPRPEMPWLVDRYDSWQRKRFAVPQGLTGWWQINGRSDKPMHLNTEDDLYYVYNYSLWLDIRILMRTPLAILQGRGAF